MPFNAKLELMKKAKKSRVTEKQGFFESPLFLSIIHLIPSILLLGGVSLGILNLYQKVRGEKQVLGAETSLPLKETELINVRLNELKEAATKINSKQLTNEIEKLTSE